LPREGDLVKPEGSANNQEQNPHKNSHNDECSESARQALSGVLVSLGHAAL
jgi:hypothetical protein